MKIATPVVAVASTGFPRNGYAPGLLEIAVIFVAPTGDVGRPPNGVFHMLVHQPLSVSDSPTARGAQRIHNIRPAASASAPPAATVSHELGAWLGMVRRACAASDMILGPWTSANNRFTAQMAADCPIGTVLGPVGQPDILSRAKAEATQGGFMPRNKNGTPKRSLNLRNGFGLYQTRPSGKGLDWNKAGYGASALPQAHRAAQLLGAVLRETAQRQACVAGAMRGSWDAREAMNEDMPEGDLWD